MTGELIAPGRHALWCLLWTSDDPADQCNCGGDLTDEICYTCMRPVQFCICPADCALHTAPVMAAALQWLLSERAAS